MRRLFGFEWCVEPAVVFYVECKGGINVVGGTVGSCLFLASIKWLLRMALSQRGFLCAYGVKSVPMFFLKSLVPTSCEGEAVVPFA